MSFTVFYAWQSDTNQAANRFFIRDALTRALRLLHDDAAVEESPRLDHDTKDVPGMPDVFSTILAKIDTCGIFVADLTPVATTANGMRVSNPNVLIELGYALAKIGDRRVIPVLNESHGSGGELPFDLARRRWPITYELADQARPTPDDERTLATSIGAALKIIIQRECLIGPDELARRRWHPVRQAVVAKLASVYSAVFNAVHHTMRRAYEAGPHDARETAQGLLRRAEKRIGRLREAVPMSVTGLSQDLQAEIALLVDDSDEVVRRLHFFSGIHDPSKLNHDFIGEPPFPQLERIEALIGRIRPGFPDVFADSQISDVPLLTCTELAEVWERAERSTGRMYRNPEHYRCRDGCIPYVIDLGHLRRIPTDSVPDGITVLVHYSL
jgi:hypothetical protein